MGRFVDPLEQALAARLNDGARRGLIISKVFQMTIFWWSLQNCVEGIRANAPTTVVARHMLVLVLWRVEPVKAKKRNISSDAQGRGTLINTFGDPFCDPFANWCASADLCWCTNCKYADYFQEFELFCVRRDALRGSALHAFACQCFSSTWRALIIVFRARSRALEAKCCVCLWVDIARLVSVHL
jgi:hypothetical protein